MAFRLPADWLGPWRQRYAHTHTLQSQGKEHKILGVHGRVEPGSVPEPLSIHSISILDYIEERRRSLFQRFRSTRIPWGSRVLLHRLAIPHMSAPWPRDQARFQCAERCTAHACRILRGKRAIPNFIGGCAVASALARQQNETSSWPCAWKKTRTEHSALNRDFATEAGLQSNPRALRVSISRHAARPKTCSAPAVVASTSALAVAMLPLALVLALGWLTTLRLALPLALLALMCQHTVQALPLLMSTLLAMMMPLLASM